MKRKRLSAAIGGAAAIVLVSSGYATPLPEVGAVRKPAPKKIELEQHRGAADHRGIAPRAPRAGVELRREGTAAGASSRVRHVPYGPARGWSRPPSYWWKPGAAVAAGVALGYATAIAAEALARTRPPAPTYCWFYTNPERTKGFWDACPP